MRKGVVTSTEKVVHRGVYPESAISAHLKKLIHYLNEDNSPMLYKIAIAHYYFGYIHPFYDGNGRTSRYISSMYLMNELDKLTAFTLSYSTNKSKQLYYDAFTVSNDPKNKGELTYFCEVFFQIMHKAQSDIIEDLSQKKDKMEKLLSLTQSFNELKEPEKHILFILGQHFIFGIEGTGMTMKELEIVLETTEYVVRKALKNLDIKGYVSFTKLKPIEVALSDSLSIEL